MPVDNIYGNFRPLDIGAAYGAGLEDRANKMRMKDLAVDMEGRKKKQQDEQDIRALYAQHTGEDGQLNQTSYLSDLAKVSPELAMQRKDQFRKQADDDFASNKMKINRVGNALEGLAGMPEEQRAQSYAQVRADLVKSGAIAPNDAPEQYDPGLFRQTLMGWRGSEEYQNREKKNAEIAKLNADAKTDPEMKRLSLDKLRAETAKLTAEANKAGKKNVRELPADKVLLVNEGNSIPSMLKDINVTIGANKDDFGPVGGRLSSMNPYNEKSQTMNSQIGAASQAFGRYMEGGVLRKEDEDKYRKMFPNMSDTPEVAKNKLAVVSRLLSQKQNSNIAALREQGFDVSGIDKRLDVAEVPSVLTGKEPTRDMNMPGVSNANADQPLRQTGSKVSADEVSQYAMKHGMKASDAKEYLKGQGYAVD